MSPLSCLIILSHSSSCTVCLLSPLGSSTAHPCQSIARSGYHPTWSAAVPAKSGHCQGHSEYHCPVFPKLCWRNEFPTFYGQSHMCHHCRQSWLFLRARPLCGPPQSRLGYTVLVFSRFSLLTSRSFFSPISREFWHHAQSCVQTGSLPCQRDRFSVVCQ